MRTSTLRLVATAVAALVLLLAAPLASFAQTKPEHLYLLGETALDKGDARFPWTPGLDLYAVDPSHNLKLVREIVPAGDPAHPGDYGDGFYAVRDDTDSKIYVTYPNIIPSVLSVIHKSTPMVEDEVEFNPDHFVVLNTDFGIAAGDGRQSYLLCTFLPPIPNRDPYPKGISSYLVSVAGDAPAKGSRVRQADWTMFSSFRYQGEPPGQSDILGYIKGGHVRSQVQAGVGPYTLPVDLDFEPPFSLDTSPGNICVIVAANSRWFAFVPLLRRDRTGPYVGAPFVCIHDRKLNTWKKLESASTVANTRRIFGSWLATIIEVWVPGEFAENPGTENGPSNTSIPGILVLDNLEDGRRIVLNTGQADSEILAVRDDGLVAYRVNDSIFAAQIEGNELGKPTLIVNDDEVPGIHWVFWSPAVSDGELSNPEGPSTAPPAEAYGSVTVDVRREQ